ncbi:alpha/beta hydrolase [Ruegeria sp. 2205SS24-7]|uniref:alpha/beta hydrolase n=1 Tax=Ruegeria discodermiae TaxID=3064389 RepID=UPI0027421CC9|nr:alpha/beta hydrolase [Ruegeria sp. 2205SS24-7]MDP5221061.1 alpha/beta hydrolase [Ruegeria sp. 2205SS24-7]
MRRLIARTLPAATACSFCVLAACGEKVYDEIALMPSPTVFAEAAFDPYEDITAENFVQRSQLFYATDRLPAVPGDPQAYYNSERGHVLRAGVVDVQSDPPLASLEMLRHVTMTRDRSRNYTLSVSDVQETGVMPFSVTRYMDDPPSQQEMKAAGLRFAQRVDDHLAASRNKDVFIYIHGYNVDFDYSTLVSKELQHFLGYQGAFISYNWPATPSRLAYFRDQESALATRRNLRSLVEYLSANTNARRIHLIGYSAGSRLAFEAVYQIALRPGPKPRLGRLILISSDLDRSYFLQSIEDGLLDAVTDVTLYQSQTDSALAMSRLVFGRDRLGQVSDEAINGSLFQRRLSEMKTLHIIDVTEAEAADTGNGHWYFRSSPWASSDLFIALLTDRDPQARGLVRAPSEAVWSFPPNYPQALQRYRNGS